MEIPSVCGVITRCVSFYHVLLYIDRHHSSMVPKEVAMLYSVKRVVKPQHYVTVFLTGFIYGHAHPSNFLLNFQYIEY